MGDTCPYLEYRASAGAASFEHERPFCEVTGEFVQPMRADVCNDRFALEHAVHCEIYRDHVDE